jgi:hypothetical protein
MGGEGDGWMTTMIGCTEGHYEVQRTSYGEAYIWCPECVVVECDCGEKLTLTASLTACVCGADHRALVEEELSSGRSSEEASHPWDADYHEWRRKQEKELRSEHDYWLEWRVVE